MVKGIVQPELRRIDGRLDGQNSNNRSSTQHGTLGIRTLHGLDGKSFSWMEKPIKGRSDGTSHTVTGKERTPDPNTDFTAVVHLM